MKNNNKGFASTFILFSLLILFLIVMSILLFTMNNSSVLNSGLKNNLIDNMEKNAENDVYKEYVVTANLNDSAAIWGDYKGWEVSGSDATKEIGMYTEYGMLPEPFKENYKFLGWYTAATGGTLIESDTQMTTQNNHTIYAHWATKPVICKRATELHTALCEQTNTSHFCSEKYKNKTITFGRLGNGNILNVGDAFDCDVDRNGTYDPETERFYYVSEYYNTKTGQFNSEKAVLVYSKIWSASAYGENNYQGPTSMSSTNSTKLPTNSQWKYIGTSSNTSFYTYNAWKSYYFSLYGTTGRQILTPDGNTSNASGTLPTAFYYNHPARLLTEQELGVNCYTGTSRALNSCEFLFEDTYWVKSNAVASYWLETACGAENGSDASLASVRRVLIGGYNGDTGTNRITNGPALNSYGVRPVIDIGKDYILLTTYNNESSQ